MRTGFVLIRRAALLLATLLFLFGAAGCARQESGEPAVAVTIVDSLFFTPSVSAARVRPGEDFTVRLDMRYGYEFVSCDYGDYTAVREGETSVLLTLHDVARPSRVTVSAQLAAVENVREELTCTVAYDYNGGVYEGETSRTERYVLTQHIRPNTWNGQGLAREGYTLLGWNTQRDGGGEHIGLGSRVTVPDGGSVTLYAEWAAWLPADDFVYRVGAGGTASVTGYRGSGDAQMFVIPARIDGYTVTEIAGSFTINIPCGSIASPVLVLPDTVRSIGGGAFTNSAFTEIYFFDSLEYVADTAFPYNLKTYHINAALPPHYQALNNSSYYADCVDRLIATADQKQLVFFAGCSFAYGVNSAMAQAAVGDEYAVCNMGVNGDINGAFQMEIILNYIGEGDILVHTPEVMSAPQLMSSFYLDGRALIMCEGNYDLFAIPDFSECDLIFRAYMHYVTIRENEEACTYADGRAEDFNLYGDYIYPRPYEEEGEAARDISYSADAYNFAPELLTEEGMAKLAGYYAQAEAKGARVCLSYSPTNGSAQTEVPVMEAGAAFDSRLRALLAPYGYAPISDWQNYVFAGRYFYDSDYHLNDLGAILRTERLLADLQAAGIALRV